MSPIFGEVSCVQHANTLSSIALTALIPVNLLLNKIYRRFSRVKTTLEALQSLIEHTVVFCDNYTYKGSLNLRSLRSTLRKRSDDYRECATAIGEKVRFHIDSNCSFIII